MKYCEIIYFIWGPKIQGSSNQILCKILYFKKFFDHVWLVHRTTVVLNLCLFIFFLLQELFWKMQKETKSAEGEFFSKYVLIFFTIPFLKLTTKGLGY